MLSVTQQRSPVAKSRQAPLGCCSAADHEALLADLEADAIGDADITRLLPRARYLLAGTVNPQQEEVPWWVPQTVAWLQEAPTLDNSGGGRSA